METSERKLYALAKSSDSQEALHALNQLVEYDPKQFLPERGWFYYKEKQYQLALDDFESAAELDPDEGALNLARFQSKHGSLEQSLLTFEKVIQLRQNRISENSSVNLHSARQRFAMALRWRADLYNQHNLLDEALNDYFAAFEADKGMFPCCAEFCKEKRLWNDYHLFLDQAIEFKVLPFLLLERSSVFEIQSNLQSALADLTVAVRRYPFFALKLGYSPKALALAARAAFFRRRGLRTKSFIDAVSSYAVNIASGRISTRSLRFMLKYYEDTICQKSTTG